jgi:hypothetical protein
MQQHPFWLYERNSRQQADGIAAALRTKSCRGIGFPKVKDPRKQCTAKSRSRFLMRTNGALPRNVRGRGLLIRKPWPLLVLHLLMPYLL